MMEHTPQISVLMPVYNGEEFVFDAILSILNQTYVDFELLILLEYGSNQKSKEIVYGFSDARVRVIENSSKLGLAASLNFGIKLARGKYIARMDADDISYPKRFEIQHAYLEKHEEISLCGAVARINGKNHTKVLSCHDEIVFASYMWCPFIHPTVMWRREDLLKKNLMYKEGIAAEDYELWMRVVQQCKTANIQKPLLMYRLYGNSRSDMQRDKLVNENDAILREYWTRNGLRYDVPKEFVSKFESEEIRCNEWKLHEIAFRTPDFKSKRKVIQRLTLDLYMKETYSIKKIYNRFCALFLDMYKSPVLARLQLISYCMFRIVKRKIRLLLERMLIKIK